MGPEGAIAIPALARVLLTDRAASNRKLSAVSLVRIATKLNDRPTTERVAAALADADPAVRVAAADGLGQLGPEPTLVVPALLNATKDANQLVRGAAVAALGLIQKNAGVDRPDVRHAIVAALNDESLHVREMGIYAFRATAEKRPQALVALLKVDDVQSRRMVVNGLVRSSPLAAAVVPQLVAALSNKDAEVRAGAALALANIRPPVRSAVPALLRAMNDPDETVRKAAARALREWG